LYLLYAPPEKFGNLPPKAALISEEVKFSFNVAYCPKFFWRKYHLMQGCRDITPGWMNRMRQKRILNNILVIATGGIGDSMWCMPFTKALREKFPRATILVCCTERAMPVWQGVPYANMCVKDEFWNLQNLIRVADEVFDFGGIATYMEKEMKQDPIEVIFKQGELPLPKDKKDLRPMIVVTIDEGKRAEALLRREGANPAADKIVAFALESSTSNRNWVFEYVKEVTRTLIAEGIKVVWFGESPDYETRNLDDETNLIGAVNLVRKTGIRDILAILALTDVFVGPASGILHMATALEVPSVGLFGAFDPRVRNKFWTKSICLWHKIDCAPCREHWTECSKGHPAPCMKVITPGEVIEAIHKLLKLYPRPAISKLPIE
jgi:ADP-heptose:LPS heptosyltransferase